ncbi:hypothetical protein BOX15_Mlig000613g1, partial [Macrostomum lignano]
MVDVKLLLLITLVFMTRKTIDCHIAEVGVNAGDAAPAGPQPGSRISVSDVGKTSVVNDARQSRVDVRRLPQSSPLSRERRSVSNDRRLTRASERRSVSNDRRLSRASERRAVSTDRRLTRAAERRAVSTDRRLTRAAKHRAVSMDRRLSRERRSVSNDRRLTRAAERRAVSTDRRLTRAA